MFLLDKIKSVFKSSPKLIESRTDEDYGFRSVRDNKAKGINGVARDEQLRMVFSLWIKNGFAKRIIELPAEFIFGDTLFQPTIKSNKNLIDNDTLIECENAVKEFILSNKLVEKFEKFYVDLSLNGMLLCPVNVNPINGKVKIGFIDPAHIDKVITNPYDITEITEVTLKNQFQGEQKILKVVTEEKENSEGLKTYKVLSGDCFYFSINNVSNQPEGVSDLLANIDFIELVSQLLYNVVDAVRLQNLFVIDVELAGMSDKEAAQWLKENPLPKKPSRFAHNEKVKQTMLSPGLRASDNSESVKLAKNFVLGNYSYPAMWFADGTDANRAIAVEQGTPIFKKLKKRQDFVVNMLKEIYMFVVQQAVLKREGIILTQEQIKSLVIEIAAPEIDTKNSTVITDSLVKLSDSLIKAVSSKWITAETAQITYITFLNNLGFNINIDSELEKFETMLQKNNMELNNPAA